MTLKDWDRRLSGMSRAEYDRETRRRRRRIWLAAAGEAIGSVLVLAVFALAGVLFLVATPDQFSAECEALRAELDAKDE